VGRVAVDQRQAGIRQFPQPPPEVGFDFLPETGGLDVLVRPTPLVEMAEAVAPLAAGQPDVGSGVEDGRKVDQIGERRPEMVDSAVQ